MSNPIVIVQVPVATEVPRGAELLGGLAAALCAAIGNLAQAVMRTPALVSPESRHA